MFGSPMASPGLTTRPAPAVSVRPATTADLPRIGGMGALLVEAHHHFDARRFLAPTPHTARGYASYMETQLDKPDVGVLVAEAGGEVIGYTFVALEGSDYLALRGPAGVIHDIIVDPGFRGRGVGRLLLDAGLGFLQARGAQRAVLMTAEKNEAAQALFARAGFRRTMIEMTRELSG